jgi:two-component system phosphate regulon sensor histidine kinase PhoR
MLVEESREIVVIIDAARHVVAASRRAREAIADLTEGSLLSADILEGSRGYVPYLVPYDLGGRSETLVYLSKPGDLAAYQELREGFTASVSHELRTPLARLMALLESAELADADIPELISQARSEVTEIGELIDDVLFLSELESGKEIVSLGTSPAAPVLVEVAGELAESAERAGVEIVIESDGDAELPLRPRMIRVIVRNLIENTIRYAGPDTRLILSTVQDASGRVELTARDNGTGVAEQELPRLFERFYRADRARSSRGTGLGLAITKHIVTAANGNVQASASDGGGLTIRCQFSGPKN